MIRTKQTLVNFIFIRHGNACHNAINTVGYPRVVGDMSYKDPQLTHYGVDMSIWMGCLIKNILKVIGINETSSETSSELDFEIEDVGEIDDIEHIDLVGCSPLIRSMETAYFMSKNWKEQPDRIRVFPFLRELDERIFKLPELTKYSDKDIYNIPEYAMKSIDEQKEYILQTFGKLKSYRFDFSSVLNFPEGREEPGDIERFIIWFYNNIDNLLGERKNDGNVFNVLIVTHAGVIRDYFGKNVFNNMGFVLQTSCRWNLSTDSLLENEPQISTHNRIDIEELFGQLEEKYSISKFLKYKAEHVCGTNGTRCAKICENYNAKEKKPLIHMELKPNCLEIERPK